MSFSHLEGLFTSATALAEASTATTTFGTRQTDTMLAMMPSPHNPPHARRTSSVDEGSVRSDRTHSNASSTRSVRFVSADGTNQLSRRISEVSNSDESIDSRTRSSGSLGTLDEEDEDLAPPEQIELTKTQSRGSKMLGKLKGLRQRKKSSSSSSTSTKTSKSSKKHTVFVDDDVDDEEYRQRTGYDFLTMGYVPGAYMGIW